MLRKAQKWREEVKIEEPLPNGTVAGFRKSIYNYDGVDREGRTGNLYIFKIIDSSIRIKFYAIVPFSFHTQSRRP